MMRRSIVVLLLVIACSGDRTRDAGPSDQPKAEAKAENEVDAKAENEVDAKTEAKPAVVVPDGPVTSTTLLAFLPETLGGSPVEFKQAADEALAAAAYRTPTGYINVNLSITRDVEFDRAQVAGAESDVVQRNPAAGMGKRGIAVGSHRGLFRTYTSGSKVELAMFLGDRINVNISREGEHAPAALVELAQELDLDGLAALASRVPAPGG